MTEPARCPKCHAELPANAPQGLCPQCLLQAAFDSRSAAAADPATDPTRLTSSGFVPPTPAALGRLFPQLEILELLGRGGMGAVYKARQKGLDRFVAVKVLPPEVGNDPAFAERFTREAKALARLNHPAIVTIHDVGQVDGLYFFVMEFVDGLNLRQLIERRELSSEQALAIVPQICEALQYAHDEGIVHRDIKPENILLDKRGRVKIADFGLAKLLGHESVDGSLTGTQQVMGTLRYMAPEQMRGARQVDHRADIYSLGVVFYELLTGELPIGRFAPPSKKVQIDVRLDEIVLRALEAEPEQRYQHASDVKTDVETVVRQSATANGPHAESAKSVATPSLPPTADQMAESTARETERRKRLAAVPAIFLLGAFIMLIGVGGVAARIEEFGKNPLLWLKTLHDAPLTFIFLLAGTLMLLKAGAQYLRDRKPSTAGASETGAGPVSLPVEGVPLIRRQLKGPAIALMLYGLIVLFPAALCFTNGFDIADGNDATPAATGFGLIALSFLLLGLAGLIIRGGWHMLAVESYRAAFLASFLGQPIGLWGLFVLSQPDVKAAFPVAFQFRSEPRFSGFAIAGAVWALFGLLAIVPILFFIGLNRVWNGTALPTDVIYAEPPLVFTIFMGALLAMGAGAPIGTTIFGALSIGHIKRSGGKIIGLPLAIADAIFFPLLLLAGMAGFVAMLIVLTAIQWGIDPRLFDKNDLPHLLIVVMAVPIWFFPARALWRAVVGPRDAFALGKLPLVGNEPPTGKAALVIALVAIAAHAWPWHWIISPPPSQRSMTISNFDVIGALQSFWLLVLSIGTALFASSATLARPAQIILRGGSVIATIVALVIQVQFFCSLGEFEPGQVEKVVRLTRTYSHMAVYVTMVLTGLAMLFFLLRLFEEQPEASDRPTDDDVRSKLRLAGMESPTPPNEGQLEKTATGPDSLASGAMPGKRPKLVPWIAAFNLVGAIVLMLLCAMEEPAESGKPTPRLWQLWATVDDVLGFVMAAGMFAASIGLFLWKPWARRVTLGVCIFGLASFVFDAPYLARFVLPDAYAEVQQMVIAEGIDPEAQDFVTVFTVACLVGGTLVFVLMCLLGQLLYFTRPRVVAAFEPQREKPGKFIEWLFTGAGAVVGVLSVFAPLALLIVLGALFNPSTSTVQSTKIPPPAPPPLGTIANGIGAEFTVPAGQVAVFEIVTRRDNETVPVPPHCGYVMAPPDSPVVGTFRWSRKPEEDVAVGRSRTWSLEIVTGGGGSGYTEGILLPDELNAAVGSRKISLGQLAPNEEAVHWGADANNLPANGLIGLRVTVIAHEFKTGGSGNAHVDWKKVQSATSTTRRKLPVDPSDSLHSAAVKGDTARVNQLINAGASVNAKDADGQTPLMKAVVGGHKSLALTLVMLGADLTEQDARGRSALMIAAERRDAAFLSRLKDLSALSYEQDAAKRQERLRAFPGVERSLLASRDVDLKSIGLYEAERLKDSDGENAVMKAARTGDWECFNLLATQLDTMQAQDKRGRTPLMHAVLGGHAGESRWKEQIEWLGQPPYFGVAGVDNIYVGAMFVFDLEKSLSVLDRDNKSVLQLAEEHDQKEIAGILRRHLGMIATNQTAEIEKGGDGVSKRHRLRGLAWRALGEIEKSAADFKKALPE